MTQPDGDWAGKDIVAMQSLAYAQKQHMRALPVQIQANAILNMNLLELQQFIETESMENPALAVEDTSRCPVCGFATGDSACPVCGASMKKAHDDDSELQDEHDYLERAFTVADVDSQLDPFRTVACEMDLNDYLRQQARMALSGRKLRIAEYLIDSLDDDGFFRESLFETAEQFAAAVPEIEEVLTIVQNFDPPGIASRDLRECLLIQLRCLNTSDPIAAFAERILMDHWDNFSRVRFKVIAKDMGVAISVIQEASEFIREHLTPHPTSLYRAPFDDLTPRDSAAVVPDVVIYRREDGSLKAEAVDCIGSHIKVDETYDEIYRSLKKRERNMSEEDCKHIREHVERVKTILEAIELRKKTIVRVASYLTEYQESFISSGPSHLKPLRQKDVAQALEVHESTICRAIANKFCRLPSGEVISFDLFFDSALPIRTMISQIIARSAEPMSDGEITRKLAEEGITIARRTVAKYREQLKVLPYQLRAA